MRDTTQKPYIGMPVSIGAGSDCNPGTIIGINKTGKTITIQYDEWNIISGSEYNGTAKYEYTANPNGLTSLATLRKNGSYNLRGFSLGYGHITLNFRARYRNPSF